MTVNLAEARAGPKRQEGDIGDRRPLFRSHVDRAIERHRIILIGRADALDDRIGVDGAAADPSPRHLFIRVDGDIDGRSERDGCASLDHADRGTCQQLLARVELAAEIELQGQALDGRLDDGDGIGQFEIFIGIHVSP